MDRKQRFEVAPDYIRSHYNPDDRLCVALINRKEGTVQQEFKTAFEMVDDKYQAHLRAANAHGADVYCTVNTLRENATGRTKADIEEVRHVYLDVDSGGRAAVDKILASEGIPKPHTVMETSPDKHQILWQVDGFEKTDAERLVRDLATAHSADQAVWDSARVLRVPGFRNCKYEQPHYVREVPGERAERIYGPEDFPRYEVSREPTAPKFGEKTQRSTSGGIGPDTSPSGKDFAFACRNLEKGVPAQVIESAIAAYRPDKPNPAKYAHDTVTNARARVVSRPAQPRQNVGSEDRTR